jgi:hypothetical protein
MQDVAVKIIETEDEEAYFGARYQCVYYYYYFITNMRFKYAFFSQLGWLEWPKPSRAGTPYQTVVVATLSIRQLR